MKWINHYQTLEISPSASLQEVKRSFRRLAMQYHPDKNPGDSYAEERFKEIQLAYSIIGSPDKRKEYDYQSWLNTGVKPSGSFVQVTPYSILKDSIRLRQYVSTVNLFSIDQDALHYHIEKLLSPQNVEKLSGNDHLKVILQITREIVKASEALKFRYVDRLMPALLKMAAPAPEARELAEHYFQRRRKLNYLDRLAPAAVWLAVGLLCWMIYKYGMK